MSFKEVTSSPLQSHTVGDEVQKGLISILFSIQCTNGTTVTNKWPLTPPSYTGGLNAQRSNCLFGSNLEI